MAIAPFLSVKLAQNGRETIQSVKVRVHLNRYTFCSLIYSKNTPDLLRVVLGVGEQRGHVKHELVFLEDGVYRVSPRHVVPDVQASAVPMPALQPDPVAQEGQKLVKVLAGIRVGEELKSRSQNEEANLCQSFLNGQTPASFCLFSSFQTHITNFTAKR